MPASLVSRRNLLKLGVLGGGLTLADYLRLDAQGAVDARKNARSGILVFLNGGPSHQDMFDMKPEAPAEYRGLWHPIPTNAPGIEITELFPLQAKCADKFSIVRSLHHNNGDHFTAGHLMLTGRGGASGADTPGKYPFVGSIATKLLGPRKAGMPAHAAGSRQTITAHRARRQTDLRGIPRYHVAGRSAYQSEQKRATSQLSDSLC